MLALCKRMFVIIAAIQIKEKYCDIYLIEHSELRNVWKLICKLAMTTADRNTETSVRDHHYWVGILMMLVSKQTIKNYLFANCCVGKAAGQTTMEK